MEECGIGMQGTLCGEGMTAAQISNSVSQVSKSSGRATSRDLPIWKSAIQQILKPAVRHPVPNDGLKSSMASVNGDLYKEFISSNWFLVG
jgi:hypothetical protein